MAFAVEAEPEVEQPPEEEARSSSLVVWQHSAWHMVDHTDNSCEKEACIPDSCNRVRGACEPASSGCLYFC